MWVVTESGGHFGSGEHHGMLSRTGTFGENLGVTVVEVSPHVQGFFGEGTSDDGVKFTREREVDGFGEPVISCLTGERARFSGL